ncbi:MAG: hydroxyisourate hydrolase [Gemmataceae bacterium]
MSGISTHVLDTSRGRPAVDVGVKLERRESEGSWKEVGRGVTDHDGRIQALLAETVAGEYRVRFATHAYGQSQGYTAFYPEVVVHVRLEAGGKYHLPLLLSPFGYSTYRGS